MKPINHPYHFELHSWIYISSIFTRFCMIFVNIACSQLRTFLRTIRRVIVPLFIPLHSSSHARVATKSGIAVTELDASSHLESFLDSKQSQDVDVQHSASSEMQINWKLHFFRMYFSPVVILISPPNKHTVLISKIRPRLDWNSQFQSKMLSTKLQNLVRHAVEGSESEKDKTKRCVYFRNNRYCCRPIQEFNLKYYQLP